MERLTGVVQRYAWGSPTAIPALLDVPADGEPWAELWFGAHPSAPSHLPDSRRLDAAIAADPTHWLGAAAAHRFDGELPYLVKVLAAAEPLSLQVHPSAAQAAAGFARENERGVPRHSAERHYRDPHHKPEILCALTPFDALCGFRPVDETVALLRLLARRGARGVEPLADLLGGAAGEAAAGTLAYAVGSLLTMPAGDQRHLVDETAAACAGDDSPWAMATGWMLRLAERYPGDAGCVVALLLNCVRLQPGEAIHLDAGALHAYLGGTGVEVMASSDNVLRGGLTSKHVDVRELLDVLDATPLVDPVLRPVADGDGDDGVLRFATRDAEFALSTVTARGETVSGDGTADGPEIVLCTAGGFDGLRRGEAAIAPAGGGGWSLTGEGTLHVVGVGRA